MAMYELLKVDVVNGISGTTRALFLDPVKIVIKSWEREIITLE